MPWLVLIQTPGTTGICAGALIAPRYVLTAGHCAGANREVFYGSPSRKAARRVAVEDAIIHPRFSRDPMTHDLALLRLVRPVRARALPVASLAEAWSVLRPNGTGKVMGWGSIPGEQRPDVLRVADVSFDEVGMLGTHIAYRSRRGGPCGGDSGGPLVVRGQDGLAVLVGVASVTDGNLCAQGGGMAAYSNAPAMLDFIREHVSGFRERPPPLDFSGYRRGATESQAASAAKTLP